MQNISIDSLNRNVRDYKKLRSILITGTKGKTSVSSMINHVFDFAKQDTLYVSTSGVFRNKTKIYSYKNSIEQFGFAPTVMPGRYIYNFLKNGCRLEELTAILESSHSCGVFGTGIYEHKVGALLNIYDDHADEEVVGNRHGLYQMKSFIFNNLAKNGHYIANLDNDLSRKSLSEQVLVDKKIHKIAFTSKLITHQKAEKLAKDLDLANLFYILENEIFSLKDGAVYKLKDFRYLEVFPDNLALKGNLLAVLAISSLFFDYKLIKKALNIFQFPFEFGRMMLFENKTTHQKVIIDYAHESESLKLMVNNLRNAYQQQPYLITRSAAHKNSSIIKLTNTIAKLDLAGLTIYDIMTGEHQQMMNFATYERKAGEVTQLMSNQLQKKHPSFSYKVILQELDALKEALDSGQLLILHIHRDMGSLKTFVKDNHLDRIL